jgi:uncharacterized membrane protein YciS (DUF1049 family)
MKISHHIDFLIALSIVIIAVVLSFVTYNRMIRVNFFMGNLRFSHWLAIIGTIGIAIATPLFTLLKRSNHYSWTKITRFHIFSNLIFFALITFHFATQVARPPSNFPELGSGIAMFIAMSLQIISGFTQRFRSQGTIYKKLINPKANKFFHASLVMVFYAVIAFHVLHGLGIT